MNETLATGTARTDRERVLGRRRERTGPGGDPMAPDAPEPRQRPTGPADVVLDCGWGRLVFGQTFAEQVAVAYVLRSEAAGARDICIYLRDPHLLVSRLPDELFIDPSLTYRLPLGAHRPAATERTEIPGLTVRPLRDADDADAVNRIYARNGMVTAPVEVLVDNAGTDRFLHLVAEASTGEIVGTITGVDHVAVFGDPENGASLWCLTVDFNTAPPGTGQALLTELADRLDERGRAFVDLSVLAENSGAIRLYERLGFHRTGTLCVKRKNPINQRLFLPAAPAGYAQLNPYARIVADEAMRRGIRVEVTDPHWGELRLTNGGRTIVTRESLSELTSAVAMSRCDDKRVTRRILTEAGLSVPRGRTATGEPDDLAFLTEVGPVVVKPARGEQGNGITVGRADRRGAGDRRRAGPPVLPRRADRGAARGRGPAGDRHRPRGGGRRRTSTGRDHRRRGARHHRADRAAEPAAGRRHRGRVPHPGRRDDPRGGGRGRAPDGRRAARGAGAGGAPDGEPPHRWHNPRRDGRTAPDDRRPPAWRRAGPWTSR